MAFQCGKEPSSLRKSSRLSGRFFSFHIHSRIDLRFLCHSRPLLPSPPRSGGEEREGLGPPLCPHRVTLPSQLPVPPRASLRYCGSLPRVRWFQASRPASLRSLHSAVMCFHTHSRIDLRFLCHSRPLLPSPLARRNRRDGRVRGSFAALIG